ncbi:acyl-CoA dehydrogenase NM domain-like protein [Aspergillus indologenus CBS 114.80]|uniref:Acyl-CoA dehydrogenase NM domain-like protein n=1 Tax=Aspergillus indologenus CBS 114.80 TaxID=1450541 RepID=A0A2V5ILU3_9EURO|nr:acyl-CoA dehydrogenase NM domain-like protein [Aspergillus indologenus CBS 114.80]
MPYTTYRPDQIIFIPPYDDPPDPETIRISYLRARSITRYYKFEPKDILDLTPKFWAIYRDDICAADIAAFSLITIQCNLVAGTLATYAEQRDEYQDLLKSVLNYDVQGQYMLTELGHGLDAKHLETTATLLPDGSFDLHTPHLHAAKYMPPTSPIEGFPRFGLVMARLIVESEDRGVRPFIVWLNNGCEMCPGVTCRVLPRRAGCKPLDHSITSFNHVRLPASAMLGSLAKPDDPRQNFLHVISRIGVGTMAISTTLLPILKRCAFVAGKYSLRRCITNPEGRLTPIITFRTQQQPILHALAQIAVFEAWIPRCIAQYTDPTLATPVRHALGVCVKAVLSRAVQHSGFHLAERCGAQGLFEYNHIIESQLESRGIAISEGDALVLSIRLTTELLLNRYAMPQSRHPTTRLAQHEISLLTTARTRLHAMQDGHRGAEYNRVLLPQCLSIVEAIGQRMAYEAALDAGVEPDLLMLYEAGVVLQDPAWFVEHCGLSREAQLDQERRALDALEPRVEELLNGLGVERFCTAPILSEERMERFVAGLPACGEAGHSERGSRL